MVQPWAIAFGERELRSKNGLGEGSMWEVGHVPEE